jgi:hypothetical protein
MFDEQKPASLPNVALLIDSIPADRVQFICDLSVYMEIDLMMRTQVQPTTAGCSAALDNYAIDSLLYTSIRVLEIGSHVLLFSTGLQKCRADSPTHLYLVNRFQSALNAVVRLIYNLLSSTHITHITSALACLQWLRVDL